MANRSFYLNRSSDLPGRTTLHAVVAFNATSAPSLLKFAPSTGIYTVAPTAGTSFITSFTRSSTGVYVLTLKDTYLRVVRANVAFLSNTSAVALLWQITVASDPTNGQAFGTAIAAGTVRTGTSSVKFTFFSSATTPADPAATEVALIDLDLQNSG